MGGYYKPGDNYFICPVCGFKKRVSDGRYRWDREFVCKADWEPRHPQELTRPRKADRIAARISRPEPSDAFLADGAVTAEDL